MPELQSLESCRIGGAYRIDDKSIMRLGGDVTSHHLRRFAIAVTSSTSTRDFRRTRRNTRCRLTGYWTVPRATLSNPFPNSITPIQQPLGQSLGRYTNLGNSIGAAGNATNGIDQYELRPAVNDRFSFSFQREIWYKFVLDFGYFQNRETNLPYAVDLNMADPNFSYETPKSVFNQSVANPFFNYLTPDKFPGTLRTQSTITIGGLLRPFPQYGVINQTNTEGRHEHLRSFEIQAQRPYAKGVSLLFAYSYQREKTQEFFDDLATFARIFTWRDTDSPRQRFTSAVRWDLPFGKGRTYLNSAPTGVDMVLGGWVFTTTTRIYSGRPLFFNQNLIVDGNPKISNPTRQSGLIPANSTIATSTDPTLPANLHRRDNPWTYAGLYGPGVWQTDGTLSKSFSITERFKLEARVEVQSLQPFTAGEPDRGFHQC